MQAHIKIQSILDQLNTVIVGKTDSVGDCVACLLAGGHLLIEDVPGVGKTTLAKAIATSIDTSFGRIQFTPDLLPTDVVGVSIWDRGANRFDFPPGPIFASIVLADEINRASPKTQSALLEVMEESRVTVDGVAHGVGRPFMVIATQNPIEMEGTYPLPEAQLDRFMFNIVIDYLSEDEEVAVVSQTTGAGAEEVKPVFSGADLLKCHQVVRRVPIAEEVVRYAVRLAANSRPGQKHTPAYVNEWVNWGAGTRAGQSLVLGAKTRALLDGRSHVTYEDIRSLAAPVLRHRILTNYRAEAEGITVEDVIKKVIELTPEK